MRNSVNRGDDMMMGDMGVVGDVGVIRELGTLSVPMEAHEALEMWGRWQRSEGVAQRKSGLEGKNYRANRCPECYENDDPCDVCRYAKLGGVPVDLKLALAVERAISRGVMRGNRYAAGMSDRDVTILLAHFRGYRDEIGDWRQSNPKWLCRKVGIRPAEYENTVAKLVQMTWNRMKQQKRA